MHWDTYSLVAASAVQWQVVWCGVVWCVSVWRWLVGWDSAGRRDGGSEIERVEDGKSSTAVVGWTALLSSDWLPAVGCWCATYDTSRYNGALFSF